MLLLIAGLVLAVLLFGRTPRLEGAADSNPSVRAYVDGERVQSHVLSEK